MLYTKAMTLIYPAIDLKDGQCVRLYQGAMDQDTVYNDDPAAQALAWAQAGFSWLHVVDLNGAVDGQPVNKPAVKAILERVDLPVQLGGGIRTLDHIETWLEAGVSRVILGTAALKNPDLVFDACARFPGQIIVGIDARADKVAVEGWVEDSETDIVDLAKKFEEAGVTAIIYTDITRDGTGNGLNMEETTRLATSVSIPVIASGGVGSMTDIIAVREAAGQNVAGVIVGKALYDGRLTPDALLTAP